MKSIAKTVEEVDDVDTMSVETEIKIKMKIYYFNNVSLVFKAVFKDLLIKETSFTLDEITLRLEAM